VLLGLSVFKGVGLGPGAFFIFKIYSSILKLSSSRRRDLLFSSSRDLSFL